MCDRARSFPSEQRGDNQLMFTMSKVKKKLWILPSVLHCFFLCGALPPLYLNMTYNEGKDVELNCTGPQSSDMVDFIIWKANDVLIFDCFGISCSNTHQNHTLSEGLLISSTLKIPSVSMDNEKTFTCEITAPSDLRECYFTLIIQVRPETLVILDHETNKVLSKSVDTNEGILSTLRCQTNKSVKPTLNLEWIIPEGLQIVEETDNEVEDEHDRRLVVPSTTLSFMPTNDDIGKIITCTAITESSTEPLQTSLYLTTESILSTISPSSPGLAQTFVTTSSEYPKTIPSEKNVENGDLLKILVCSSGAVLLIALAVISIKIIVLRKTKERDRKGKPNPGTVTSVDELDVDASLPTLPAQTSMLESSPEIRPVRRAPRQTLVPLSDEALEEQRRAIREASEASGISYYNVKEGPLDPTVVYATVHKMNKTRRKNTQGEKDNATDTSALYATVNKKSSTARSLNSNEVLHVDRDNQFIMSKDRTDNTVLHIHKPTTTGMVEYAVVNKTKTRNEEGRTQVPHSKLSYLNMDDQFYNEDITDDAVPHVHKVTTSGMVEYAVVNKTKKRSEEGQAQVSHSKVPTNPEVEYIEEESPAIKTQDKLSWRDIGIGL